MQISKTDQMKHVYFSPLITYVVNRLV